MRSLGMAILTVLATGVAVFAQGPPPGGPHGGMGPREFGMGMQMHGKVVTGAPYSATFTNSSSETLADGNTIQHTTTGSVARDSQGRTYEQVTVSGGPMAQNGPATLTFINDPVAGYSYALNTTTKVAMRRAIKQPPSGTNPPHKFGHEGPGGNADNRVETDLGTQSIGGVNATGKSVTHTIPAGAMGNAQPIVSMSETWYSPDLQIPVSAKRTDPRSGVTTYTLTNIQRAEPAATLFQVPSDYTLKDAPTHGGPSPAQ